VFLFWSGVLPRFVASLIAHHRADQLGAYATSHRLVADVATDTFKASKMDIDTGAGAGFTDADISLRSSSRHSSLAHGSRSLPLAALANLSQTYPSAPISTRAMFLISSVLRPLTLPTVAIPSAIVTLTDPKHGSSARAFS
jgi:hypothetical protein